MSINPNIAMGYKQPEFDSPVNQLSQLMQMKQMQQANQLNQMKMDEYGRGIADQNALRQVIGGFGTDTAANQQALLKAGRLKEAQEYGKGNADILKTQSEAKYKDIEAANKRADLAGSVFGYVRQNPTVENAFAAIDNLAANGVYSPEQAAEYKAKVQSNPQAVAQMADMAFRGALAAKDQLAKLGDFNAGGSQQFTSTDPVSGNVTMTGAVPITESANNISNNARIAQEGALNRGVQIRGQNLVDARSKEATQSGKAPSGYRWSADGKTLEAITGGPADKASVATEGERKAGTLLQRLEFSQKQLDQARKDNPGATKPNLLSNGLEMVGMDSAANTIQSAERQRIEGAQLDMLDAALTLGTGAAYTREQLKGYAKSYFPQIGDDSDAVKDKDARLKNVISAAKIAAGRAAKTTNTGGATGDFGSTGKFKYLGTE